MIRYTMGIIFACFITACGGENTGFPKSECGGNQNPCPSYPISVEVTPQDLKTPSGFTIEYNAVATMSDGTTQNVTTDSIWQITDTNIAKIEDDGIASTLSPGETRVLVSFTSDNGISVSDETSLTVNDIDLLGLEISPSIRETLVGFVVDYQALAKYQTGEIINVTSSSDWAVSNTAIASLQQPMQGLQPILATSVGLTKVSAQFNSLVSQGQLTVIDSPAKALVISPVDVILPQGTEKQYQADLILQNDNAIDVTLYTQWSIADSSIGAFDKTLLFSANSEGTTTISAAFTYDDIALQDTTLVTVAEATEQRLLITPQDGQFPLGSQGQYQAFALYTNGDVQEVTSQTIWSLTESVGSIISSGDQAGYATATSVGVTQVEARFGSAASSTSAEVTAAELVEVSLAPINENIPSGTQLGFQGFARFTDDSVQDITLLGAWSSSQQNIAQIGFRGATSGIATGLAPGDTQICVRYISQEACTTLSVTAAVAERLVITPSDNSVPLGTKGQYTATAYYTDGMTADVTKLASWQSDETEVARIVASGMNAGFTSSVSVGETTISAQFEATSDTTQLTITDAQLEQLVISPVNSSIAKGNTQQFTLTGVYSDGGFEDLTDEASWQTDNTAIAYFEKKGLASGAQQGTVTVSAKVYDSTVTASLSVTEAELEYITLTPPFASIAQGHETVLVATAYYSDSSQVIVSDLSTWSSLNPEVAAVVATGLSGGRVSGLSPGQTVVTAYFMGESNTATITVTDAVVDEVVITPKSATVSAGDDQGFTLTAIFSNGDSLDVTTLSDWQSAIPAVATVDPTGLASSYVPGSTVITGSYQGFQDTATLTVTDAVLTDLIISPPDLVKPKGIVGQYIATAYYSDGSSDIVTADSVWQSSDVGVVSILTGSSGAGQATAIEVGSTEISARFGGKITTTSATVTDAELLKLVLSPLDASIPAGTTLQYSLTGIYTDSVDRDLTAQANWQTSNTTIANVGSFGDASGNGEGQVTVTAAVKGKTISTSLTVTAATITKIVVSPKNIELPLGHSDQFFARAYYSDFTDKDITYFATWVSDDADVVHIATGSQGGQIEGVSIGTTIIEVRYGGFSDTGQVTVTEALLESVVISPKTSSVAAGVSQQYELLANFSDGNQITVTGSASWQTDNSAVAQITTNDGLADTYTAGTVTVTGAYDGFSDSAQLTVTEAVITRLQVTPTTAEVPAGTEGQFVATAFYSNGDNAIVTTTSLWQSDDTSVVKVNAIGGNAGQAKAIDEGSTTVTARYQGQTASTDITVTTAQLTDIQVTPDFIETFAGDEITYTAIGLYSNGNSTVITDFVTWNSSRPDVADFTTSANVSTYSEGETVVTANYLGKNSNEAQLNVSVPVLDRLVVYPSPQTTPAGTNIQFYAHAYFSDSSNYDVTDVINWRADNTSVASHSDDGNFSALMAGTTDVIAVYDSTEARGELSVTQATLDELTIAPIEKALNVDETQAFQTFASFSDGNSFEVTGDSNWQTGSSIASVDTTGIVTANDIGDTTVSATYKNRTVVGNLSIANKAIERIEVRPHAVDVYQNETTQLRAYAIHPDSTDTDITQLSTWTSAAPFTVSVIATGADAGLVKAYNIVSTVNIKAEYDGNQDTAKVSVTQRPPTPTDIIIEPRNSTMRTFEDLQLQAFIIYNGNTFFRTEVTDTAVWTLSNPNLAFVSKPGLIHALERGDLVVTAAAAGFSSTANITIRDELPDYLEIDPLNVEVPVDTVGRFTSTAYYPSGRIEDVTSKVTWKTDDINTVYIVTFGAEGGTATARKAGATTISANLNGVKESTTVTVTDTQLEEVYIEPDQFTLNVNETRSLAAFARFTNGDTEEVTLDGDWISQSDSIASVDSQGMVTGNSTGDSTLTFAYKGMVATAYYQVIERKLERIEVDPEDLSFAIDEESKLTAIGHYDNGDQDDISDQVTWTVEIPEFASINVSGVLTGEARGFTEVYAELDGKIGTAYVYVSYYILKGTVVRPDQVTLSVGESTQLQCFNVFALVDDEFVFYEEEITDEVIWRLGFSADVASFSAPGLLTATRAGSNQIECPFDLQDGSFSVGISSLTVTD